MRSIRLTYQIESKDFVRINIWAGLERNTFIKILFRYGFYTIDLLIAIFAILAKMPWGYFLFIGLLALFPLIMLASVVRRAKRNYAKNRFFQENKVTIKVDEVGICESFFSQEYCNTWDEILLIEELKDLFVILVENIRVLYIPKSVLVGDDRATVRELVLEKMDRKRVRNIRH